MSQSALARVLWEGTVLTDVEPGGDAHHVRLVAENLCSSGAYSILATMDTHTDLYRRSSSVVNFCWLALGNAAQETVVVSQILNPLN